MRKLTAREAVQNFSQAKDRAIWSVGDQTTDTLGYEKVSGEMGGARVYRGYATPVVTPKFQIHPDAKVFASGSCFAREIELAFANDQTTVLSWSPGSDIPPRFFHRYNTFCIGNDFKGAFGEAYDDRLVFQTPAGWIDYSFYGPTESRDKLLHLRTQVFTIHRRIASADVFIITLGLAEAWFDNLTNTYLNMTPVGVLSRNMNRFECRITGYDENLLALQELVRFIRSKVSHDLKIVITVSPVPFDTTFSGTDIVTANTLSKATLRCVAQAVADSDPNIDYFPSYEAVMLSAPDKAWMRDYRHVTRPMVSHIVQCFRNAYMPTSGAQGSRVA